MGNACMHPPDTHARLAHLKFTFFKLFAWLVSETAPSQAEEQTGDAFSTMRSEMIVPPVCPAPLALVATRLIACEGMLVERSAYWSLVISITEGGPQERPTPTPTQLLSSCDHGETINATVVLTWKKAINQAVPFPVSDYRFQLSCIDV